MAFMLDVDAKALEFSHESLNLLFHGISAHVSKILVRLASEDLVYRPSEPVGDGDLRFVGGSEASMELSIFGSIEGSLFLLGSVCRLDEELPQMRVALSAF